MAAVPVTNIPDVLVIGGGVVGCALSRELASRGLDVTVVERGQPGEEASWAAGFQKEVTAEAIHALTGAAIRLVPELARARFVEAWSGLRPGTPDGPPLLGRTAAARGLLLAAGHYRNGVLLAPVTARIVADLVTSSGSRDLSPFSPDRFAEKSREVSTRIRGQFG